MKKKRFLSLFAAFALVCSLVGCKADIASANVKTETKNLNQIVNEAAEIKTIEPPEDGWTHEQISEVTYLCGKPFSLPCKLEDLLNDFEISKVVPRNKDTEFHTYITVNGQDSGFYDVWIQIDSEDVGLAHYYVSGNDKIVFSIEFSPDLHERDILVINGINQNSSFVEIKKSLGKTFTQDADISYLYSYMVINSEYPEEYVKFISFNDDEEIAGFCYSLFEVKKEK